ncbi:MAG: hypothetical protein QXO69_03550 [archaeon]
MKRAVAFFVIALVFFASFAHASWVNSYAGATLLGTYVFRGAGSYSNAANNSVPLTEQIREMMQNQAATRLTVRQMASQLNVSMKEATVANVQRLRERITARVMNAAGVNAVAKERISEARALRYDYAFERSSTEMEKITEYLKGKGKNTTELEGIKERFYQGFSDLQENETQDAIIKQMRETRLQFMNKLQELAPEEKENALNYALQYINQNNASMNRVRAENWAYLKNVSLDIFDRRVQNAERVLGVFENNSIIDVAQLRAKLNEIKSMRTQLEAAFESQNYEEAKEVAERIQSMWREYREIHANSVQSQARTRVMERLEAFIGAAESKAMKCGMTMETAQIRAMIQEAKNNPDAVAGVKAELARIRETLRNAVECKEASQ